MKKYAAFILIFFFMFSSASAINIPKELTLEVKPESHSAVLFKITPSLSVGPLSPGTHYSLKDSEYQEAEGKIVEVMLESGRLVGKCPYIVIDGSIHYFVKSSENNIECDYKQFSTK